VSRTEQLHRLKRFLDAGRCLNRRHNSKAGQRAKEVLDES
jgi:hypothetical protein